MAVSQKQAVQYGGRGGQHAGQRDVIEMCCEGQVEYAYRGGVGEQKRWTARLRCGAMSEGEALHGCARVDECI